MSPLDENAGLSPKRSGASGGERRTVLVVTHQTVLHPITEVGAELALAGMDVRWTDAAAFNAADGLEPEVDILLVSNAARCGREVLARFPQLIAVVFIASGTESVDLDAATERGIVVAHGHSEENADSMAEATILLMLSVLYDLHRAERILREDEQRPAAFSRMLKGRTVGLVGYGKIARGVAERLRGWGCGLLVATRSLPASVPSGMEIVDIDTLMARSNVVSIHAALNAHSRGMIGAGQLALLRRGSVFINTGRGGLVDEAALARAAVERELWLGLDTFEREPLPSDSPLRSLPRTILTPHLLGHTVEGNRSIVRTAVENIERLTRGLPPLHSRNGDHLRPIGTVG